MHFSYSLLSIFRDFRILISSTDGSCGMKVEIEYENIFILLELLCKVKYNESLEV